MYSVDHVDNLEHNYFGLHVYMCVCVSVNDRAYGMQLCQKELL